MLTFNINGSFADVDFFEFPAGGQPPAWFSIRLWGKRISGGTYTALVYLNHDSLTAPQGPLQVPPSAGVSPAYKSADVLLFPGDVLTLHVPTFNSPSNAIAEVRVSLDQLGELL